MREVLETVVAQLSRQQKEISNVTINEADSPQNGLAAVNKLRYKLSHTDRSASCISTQEPPRKTTGTNQAANLRNCVVLEGWRLSATKEEAVSQE